nr:PREDICTED: nucleolar protein 11 [Bemisia tabaci]
MAKLSTRFDLCRLIDLKSLLGVSEDSEPGCVIVTLGKNIVIRFKINDQKQESSWSSKDKLSAPVVFDNNQEHYVGVFNGNQIRLWTKEADQLDKIKKYKFSKEIFGVIAHNELKRTTVVVFRDGCVLPLSVALEDRKNIPDTGSFLNATQTIDQAQLLSIWNHEFVVLHTTKDQEITCLELVPLLPETLSHVSLELKYPDDDGIKLVGHCVHAFESCQLITLWSNGKLYSMELLTSVTQSFPGRCLATLSVLNSKHPVKITSIGSHHIAIYGADPSEEGAVLIIFNIQFSLVQCRQLFKLFSNPPRLWVIGSNLILAEQQHLKVIPFRLSAQRLSALIGSHRPAQREGVTVGEWVGQLSLKKTGQKPLPPSDVFPESVVETIKELTLSGSSESVICEVVVPQLIEKNSLAGLTWILHFFVDIPDASLLKILVHCLKNPSETEQKGVASLILQKPAVQNVRLFRSHSSFQSTVNLLSIINELLGESLGDCNILNWACLCLDAYYQQFLLIKDASTLELLKSVADAVSSELDYMESLKELGATVRVLNSGEQGLNRKNHTLNKKYAIHFLHFFNSS